jgi:ABC-type antimicrobial peptide transport system permease subunit
VVILNEAAARALWPRESPIGKIIHGRWFGPVWFTYTVVGVVRDTKYATLEDAHVPFAYVPLAQEDFARPLTFIGRSNQPLRALAAIQSTLASIAPDLRPPGSLALPARLISQQVDMVLAPQRLAIVVLSVFAFLALCISAVGIYGSVAFATSRRTIEIGIRVALGARAVDILRLVLSEASIAVISGLIAGICAASVTLRYVEHFVYGVATFDPMYVVCAIGILGVAAIFAAFVPSLRALRVDPVLAMRASE